MAKCTCGANSIGSSYHSDWCDFHKKEDILDLSEHYPFRTTFSGLRWDNPVLDLEDLSDGDPIGTVRYVTNIGDSYVKISDTAWDLLVRSI